MPWPAERANAHGIPPAESLAEFGDFVERAVGLHFPAGRVDDLRRALTAAAREAGAGDARRYVAGLVSQPASRAQIEQLAGHVTIGETYFFRDPASFECLERHVVPELVRSRAASRRLRAWSAGCSSGEEPYSLAITLARCLAGLGGWKASVLATDINPRALRRGRTGVYGEWSFRATSPSVKREFFRARGGGRFEVQAAIRSMVEFAYLNLADAPLASPDTGTNAMDIILCRNVLMYFEPRRALAVLRKLQHALAPGGWLFLSPVEIPAQIPDGLARAHFPGVIALRKTAGADATAFPADRGRSARDDASAAPAGTGAPDAPVAVRRRTEPRRAARLRRGELPRSGDVYQQAHIAYERGDYAQALACLERIVAAEPVRAEALALIARIHANEGRLDDAFAWCERAIEADKLCPAWPYLRATLFLAHDRLAEASSSLRRALFLDPRHVLAHLMLGSIAQRQGASAQAGRHLRNALTLASALPAHEIIDASEGLPAGRVVEIIESMLGEGDRP